MTSNRLRTLRYRVPDDLKVQLSAQIAADRSQKFILHLECRSWLGPIGVLAASIALIVWLVVLNLSHRSGQLDAEVTSAHIRSLMASHIFDVASTDQHTVKPWFAGKIDFSPKVIDFQADGYPLVGGRLDYMDGHSVAAIVYKHNQHVINVFCWAIKSDDSGEPVLATEQGFNIWHWTSGGMQFYAVSDLNAKDLKFFADKLR